MSFLVSACLVASLGNGATPGASLEVMTPQGRVKHLDFVVDEGTEMNVDVAASGKWLAFDLLGHIYRLDLSSGETRCLTRDSGVAIDIQPRISPDGTHIVFVSDRSGQNNIWLMDTNGDGTKPLWLDPDAQYFDPAWSPDGKAIVAVRMTPSPGRGWQRRIASIWLLPVGGQPRELLAGRIEQYYAPDFSPDGRSIYLHSATMAFKGLSIQQINFRIQRLHLPTGALQVISRVEPNGGTKSAYSYQDADAEVVSDFPAEIRPQVSPDGRWLAFAREWVGSNTRYGRFEYNRRTVLMLRDLRSGSERILLDPISKDLTSAHAGYNDSFLPRFGWTADGAQIVLAAHGKLVRVNFRDGAVTAIPFQARVQRDLSESVRSQYILGDDRTLSVSFLQWPARSPDGARLAFVAVGRLWIADLTQGNARTVADAVLPSFAFSPAWSPDGRSIAFTTWDDRKRGQVWTLDIATGRLRQITWDANEYLYPKWTADGADLIVAKGADNTPKYPNGWNKPDGWKLVRLAVATRHESNLVTTGAIAHPALVGDRVYFYTQLDADIAEEESLQVPFPSTKALQQYWMIRSVPVAGGQVQDHLQFPAAPDRSHEPLVSPDGRFVAFNDAHRIFVQRIDRDSPAGIIPVDTNPQSQVPGRSQADEFGGAYYSWSDDKTLQFFSGRRYVQFDASIGTRRTTELSLEVPRETGKGKLLLRDAKIITTDEHSTVLHGDVLIEDARIACVGRCSDAGVDRVFDLHGKTLMPGLIDVHEHIADEPSQIIPQHRSGSALALAYGVTTIRDPAVSSLSLFPLSALVETGQVIGPRTLGSAEIVITRATAWGDQTDIRDRADALYNVRRRIDWGANVIKNYRVGSRSSQQLLIGACRQLSCNVTSEGGSLSMMLSYVLDGQTGWEHAFTSLPIYKDVIQFFGQSGLSYSPTAGVAGHVPGASAYFRAFESEASYARYRRFDADPNHEEGDHQAPPRRPKEAFSFPLVAQGLADVLHAGGYGAIGEHGSQPGIGSHWEIWAYAEALSAQEAITVATRHGARFLGIEQDTGSIEVGKLADLIVLNADPLADIRNTANISHVVKSGVLFDAATLERLWPVRRPY